MYSTELQVLVSAGGYLVLRWAASSQALQVLRSVAAGEQVWATSRAAQPLHQRWDDAAATTAHWLAHQKPKEELWKTDDSSPGGREVLCSQLKRQTGRRVCVESGSFKIVICPKEEIAMENKVLPEPRKSQFYRLSPDF